MQRFILIGYFFIGLCEPNKTRRANLIGIYRRDHSKDPLSFYLNKKVSKVEFIQLFCWFYFVPNFLVIQHLESLYLGGNHVRVVCERV